MVGLPLRHACSIAACTPGAAAGLPFRIRENGRRAGARRPGPPGGRARPPAPRAGPGPQHDRNPVRRGRYGHHRGPLPAGQLPRRRAPQARGEQLPAGHGEAGAAEARRGVHRRRHDLARRRPAPAGTGHSGVFTSATARWRMCSRASRKWAACWAARRRPGTSPIRCASSSGSSQPGPRPASPATAPGCWPSPGRTPSTATARTRCLPMQFGWPAGQNAVRRNLSAALPGPHPRVRPQAEPRRAAGRQLREAGQHFLQKLPRAEAHQRLPAPQRLRHHRQPPGAARPPRGRVGAGAAGTAEKQAKFYLPGSGPTDAHPPPLAVAAYSACCSRWRCWRWACAWAATPPPTASS